MDMASDIIEHEIQKYESIQEKFRKDKNDMNDGDEKATLLREVKSSLLLQAMYNLEEKAKAETGSNGKETENSH